MKATFDKQKLLAAITPAAGISQTKNTLTSVDGLLFECPPNPKYGDYDTDNPNLCRISAFDLEKGLRTTVECNVYEKGMFVINTVKILQIVRALPDGEVTLDIDERGHVNISCGMSHFEITATPGEDFPTMPMFIGERVYKIPQQCIKSLIDTTVYAVGQNDTRAAFNGALFKIRNGELTVIGCDGNRLSAAKEDISATNPEAPEAEMIIPGKFLGELTKLLRDTEDELTMMIGRKHIIFKIDTIYFFTRMLDTEYFDYEKLLPNSYKTQAFVSRKELLGAIERASIVTEDKLGGSSRSHVKLDFMDNAVTMTSVSAGGSVYEKVPAAIDGEGVSIGFNCRYLLDALKAAPSECERLRIRLNSPLMGIVIEPASGTTFLSAHPDEEVFGDRANEAAVTTMNEEACTAFMYFVMPVRMNK
ncbi:MAG: DNA polymerase III subunit beta [Clostridia bacterium]|nr:DNA polymerase III subunit beta [Clostridia bacterium]MBQ8512341.1 DNA polymerase III subunit beta [Clostridia bacterium]